jgi:hypothetical protein
VKITAALTAIALTTVVVTSAQAYDPKNYVPSPQEIIKAYKVGLQTCLERRKVNPYTSDRCFSELADGRDAAIDTRVDPWGTCQKAGIDRITANASTCAAYTMNLINDFIAKWDPEQITTGQESPKQETHSWLGVETTSVSQEIAKFVGLDKSRFSTQLAACEWIHHPHLEQFCLAGASIKSIYSGSPADQSGLQPEDVILAYNGTRIKEAIELGRLVADTAPNTVVKLTIWRDNEEQEVNVTIAAR